LIQKESVSVLKGSPLHGVLQGRGRDGADGQRRLRIGESRGWSLTQIAAFPTTTTEFQLRMRQLLGAELPPRVGQAVTVGPHVLLKTAPEVFWVITRTGEDIAPALQSAVAPEIGSITALSHSRTCIWIEGPPAREVLASAITLDLHPDFFRPAFFALTAVHHTPLLIHRTGENRYELYVTRTFAVWTWDWLADAALRFGYEVLVPD
jgi:heterotetrameric sarcosine oxidase gamma subunit